MARQLERFPNLVAMFFTRARERGDAPFLWTRTGGQWVSTSWAEAARQVAALATALKAIGLKRGDRVMLVSENRPEWCISDLAIMAAGCVTVPTYVTNTVRDHGPYHREFGRVRDHRVDRKAGTHRPARRAPRDPIRRKRSS